MSPLNFFRNFCSMITEEDDTSTNRGAPLYLHEKTISLNDKKIFALWHVTDSTRVYVGTNDGSVILVGSSMYVICF